MKCSILIKLEWPCLLHKGKKMVEIKKRIGQRALVSAFADRTMPTLDQNLQKSFQVPAREKRNFKKCHTAQEDIENED